MYNLWQVDFANINAAWTKGQRKSGALAGPRMESSLKVALTRRGPEPSHSKPGWFSPAASPYPDYHLCDCPTWSRGLTSDGAAPRGSSWIIKALLLLEELQGLEICWQERPVCSSCDPPSFLGLQLGAMNPPTFYLHKRCAILDNTLPALISNFSDPVKLLVLSNLFLRWTQLDKVAESLSSTTIKKKTKDANTVCEEIWSQLSPGYYSAPFLLSHLLSSFIFLSSSLI